MTEPEYDEDGAPGTDCRCGDPDPERDEPWVPVTCANCGGLL
jgi:hypothetical protein